MDICWSNVNQVSPPREVIMRIGLIVIEKNTNLAVKCFNSLHDSGFQGRNTVKMFPSYTGSGAACFAIVGWDGGARQYGGQTLIFNTKTSGSKCYTLVIQVKKKLSFGLKATPSGTISKTARKCILGLGWKLCRHTRNYHINDKLWMKDLDTSYVTNQAYITSTLKSGPILLSTP